MSPRTQKILTAVATVAMLLVLVWAQGQGWLGTQEGGAGGSAKPPVPQRPAPQPPESQRGPEAPGAPDRGSPYAPQGPAPAQALPGGSLKAHEGRGHTIERHVGRTDAQLKARLTGEQKREVSTFPDLQTAEKAIARALFERRRQVQEWLAEGARGDMSVTWRSNDVVGRVLRDDAREPKAGHTTHVVLVPSDTFSEGFAILTAYVRLP